MATRSALISIQGDAKKFEKTVDITGDLIIAPAHGSSNLVPAAKVGTLTTRTNDTDGTITLTGGHGLSTGTFDLHWEGGSRRGVTCTITVNACVISGGSAGSTALPLATTTIYVSPIESDGIGGFANGNAITMISIWAENQTSWAFHDGSGLIAGAEGLIAAGQSYVWFSGLGTSPVAGQTPTILKLSQMGADGGKVRGEILY